MEIWEPKPPGNLWATSGLLEGSFTFYMHLLVSFVIKRKIFMSRILEQFQMCVVLESAAFAHYLIPIFKNP